MALPTRWNPFRAPTTRFNPVSFNPVSDLEEIFRGFGGFGLRPLLRDTDKSLDMPMDVVEDDSNYRITMDVPGVRKDDIEVSVEGNQIAISAEVKRENIRDNEKELYAERYSGRVYRAFSLPHELDSNKCDARYDNGVLQLTLPKKAGSSAVKRLPIH